MIVPSFCHLSGFLDKRAYPVLRASLIVRGLGKSISSKPYPCDVGMQGGCVSNPQLVVLYHLHQARPSLAFWMSIANKQSLFLIHFATLVLLPHTILVGSSISEMRKTKQLSLVIVDSSWLELPSTGART